MSKLDDKLDAIQQISDDNKGGMYGAVLEPLTTSIDALVKALREAMRQREHIITKISAPKPVRDHYSEIMHAEILAILEGTE
jgi:hypothetical protein